MGSQADFCFPASRTIPQPKLKTTKRSPAIQPRTAPATGVRGQAYKREERVGGGSESKPSEKIERSKSKEAYLPRPVPIEGDRKAPEPSSQQREQRWINNGLLVRCPEAEDGRRWEERTVSVHLANANITQKESELLNSLDLDEEPHPNPPLDATRSFEQQGRT
jgi:hypothetical protein